MVVLPGQSFNPLAGMGFPFGQMAGPESRAMLELIPPHLRQALGRAIQLSRLLEERPVVLMSPYLIRVR